MKIAYTAGPYRSKTEWGLYNNIHTARGVAVILWGMGFGVICPHANTALFGGSVNDNDDVADTDNIWLKGDIEFIKRAVDVLVVLPGWENSSGTKLEIATASVKNIPIIYWEDGDLAIEELKEILKG